MVYIVVFKVFSPELCPSSATKQDGKQHNMETANHDYEKTRLEWAREGMCPRKGCSGTEMWDETRFGWRPDVFFRKREVRRDKRGADAYIRKVERHEAALKKAREKADQKLVRHKIVLLKDGNEFVSDGKCWKVWVGDMQKDWYKRGYVRMWRYLPKSVTVIVSRDRGRVEFTVPGWFCRKNPWLEQYRRYRRINHN